MRNHYFFSLACLLAGFLFFSTACSKDEDAPIDPVIVEPENAPDKTGMASDAPALAARMGQGWNLGNSLEACSSPAAAGETMWGNPRTTKALIDAVKAAGFTTVRIPCAWSGYVENPTTYKIQSSWLERVGEVVDYCVANDMYAIINIHWDRGWLEENPVFTRQEAVLKKEKALWEQIAVYFRDYDEHLLFAGTNEVHNTDYSNPTSENIVVQLSYNQTFVDAVRSTGGRNAWRNLIVQAFNTNIDHAISYLKMPKDDTPNRLMAEVHYYDPWEFTGMEKDEDWGTVKYLWGKEGGFGQYGLLPEWGQEDYLRSQFARMKTAFGDKGYPVIIGEYGATLRTLSDPEKQLQHIASRNYYLGIVTQTALANGFVPIYWDNGNTGDKGSGLFNRSTGDQVHADAIKAIIQGIGPA